VERQTIALAILAEILIDEITRVIAETQASCVRASRGSTKTRRCSTAPHEDRRNAEAIAMLPPDQLARFRRWFAAFEACRSDHAKELDSTAIKLGRLAGRALAELRRRVVEP
jgi:hypothetical protein